MNELSISIKMGFCQLWRQMKYYQIFPLICRIFIFLSKGSILQLLLFFLLHELSWTCQLNWKISHIWALKVRCYLRLNSYFYFVKFQPVAGRRLWEKAEKIWNMKNALFALHSHFIKHCSAHFTWYHIFQQIFHSELFCTKTF